MMSTHKKDLLNRIKALIEKKQIMFPDNRSLINELSAYNSNETPKDYYLKVTGRTGKFEIVHINKEIEIDGVIWCKGRILYSEIVPGDEGIFWENTKNNISKRIKRYEFSKKGFTIMGIDTCLKK